MHGRALLLTARSDLAEAGEEGLVHQLGPQTTRPHLSTCNQQRYAGRHGTLYDAYGCDGAVQGTLRNRCGQSTKCGMMA
eukprot:1684680-Pyramimonas_sp.AAC.1